MTTFDGNPVRMNHPHCLLTTMACCVAWPISVAGQDIVPDIVREFHGDIGALLAQQDSLLRGSLEVSLCSAGGKPEVFWVYNLGLRLPDSTTTSTSEAELRKRLIFAWEYEHVDYSKPRKRRLPRPMKKYRALYVDSAVIMDSTNAPCRVLAFEQRTFAFLPDLAGAKTILERYLEFGDLMVFRIKCFNALLDASWMVSLDREKRLRWL